MNLTIRKSVLTLILLLLVCSDALAGQFQVTRVYDGDSFTAVGHDITIKVRLAGIDAPEKARGKREGQPFGDEAGRFLRELVLGKTVDIDRYGTDRYNRILAVVTVDGKCVNLEMLKAGLAEVYGRAPAGLDMGNFRLHEKMAREDSMGMWVLADRYLSPAMWRKLN